MPKLLLVDTPNQIFRAYYGIQTDMRAPDGFPTRALFGFTRIMKALLRDIQPDYLACVFDKGADARLALWPDYKGTRPDMPDDLRQQWDEFEPLCRAFGFAVLEKQGVEADDIIGTLARRFGKDDVFVQIVSGDKDFCQLVNDNVSVLDIGKNVAVDRAGVVERWGVPPERVVDLLSLMGDTSDNVPGVPGVGPKKAAQYIEKYQSLDGVLAAWKEIGGKTGEAVRDNADRARLARQLVEIDTNIDVSVSLDGLRLREPDADELKLRLLRYNFKTLWNELGLGDRAEAAAATVATGSGKRREVWGQGPLARLADELRASRRFAVALERAPDDPATVRRIALAWAGGWATVPAESASFAALREILEDEGVAKVAYELKPLYKLLRDRGIRLRGLGGDNTLADYALQPEARRTLDHVKRRWLEEAQGAEPGDEARDAWRIDEVFASKLADDRVYRDIELPLLPILAEMERVGIACEAGALSELSVELGKRVEVAQGAIWQVAGEEFNVNSPQQVATILYDKLSLQSGKKTKTGRSTDAETLEKLGHPLADAILAFRELYKLKNTYVDALPRYIAADGRIHTTFGQAVAATGRLSSIDPNLQNIPIRTEDGKRIRACFVAKPGHVLLSCDYSQIELRVLAHYCKEGPLVESYQRGEDIHRRTASEVFGVAAGLVTGEMRRAAKAINFGIVYGMGAFRLANELKISRGQAAAYIDGYFARYPQVRAYMESATARARELGYAETLYGRRRPIKDLDASNQGDRAQAERIAINTPIQGSAADLIKKAMIAVDGAIARTSTTMLLQVHDELVFELPEDRVSSEAPRICAIMESVVELAVPLKVEWGSGRTWASAH
ncbi:MAG: DNA polymerase I [Deltaproteobacteria bacterium]|nr:DNA polymerase I [Deltaproteobacteria bacterium]